MTALQSFLRDLRADPSFLVSLERKPSLERSLRDAKRLFDLLESSTDSVATDLRAAA
jgi:hypothetical protein